MSKLTGRILALILVLVTVVSWIPTVGFSASAADVSYNYDGKYIYNWGERGEVATFLSPNAESFYKKYNTSYDILSSYTGGTTQSNAPSSKLNGSEQCAVFGAEEPDERCADLHHKLFGNQGAFQIYRLPGRRRKDILILFRQSYRSFLGRRLEQRAHLAKQ